MILDERNVRNVLKERSIAYFRHRRKHWAKACCVTSVALVMLLSSFAHGQMVAGAVQEQPSVITLKDVLRLARAYSPLFQTAQTNVRIAHENRIQARDARLPTVNALNQFVYTEGNGTPSGVFIANDGVHVYNEQALVRENLLSLVRSGPSQHARAAEVVAVAQEEIARRGLVATVVQDYYNLPTSQRKVASANESLQQALQFVDITSKQEQAGIMSHVDVVKAEMQAEQRSQDVQNQTLAVAQARLSLAVLLFPRFDQTFTVIDDLADLTSLPSASDALATATAATRICKAHAPASLRPRLPQR